MTKMTKLGLSAAVALGGALGSATPVQAQQIEKVEITGSSIRRIDVETALPVQVLRREDIERTGATSVTELLQRLPAIQGSVPESSAVGGGSAGITTVSLHNLGDQRTLVLLNGHRLAQFGGQSLTGAGAAVDLNVIPFAAIERVEILTDGASALYGADAVAGVVNVVTRKDTSEGDITVGYSSPRGGAKETRLSATKGFGSLADDGYNVMLSFSHDQRTQLAAAQRRTANSAERVFTRDGKTYRAQLVTANSIPANVLHDNGTLPANPADPADPAYLDDYTFSPYFQVNGSCPARTFRYADGVNDFCAFDFAGELEIYPERKRDTFLGSFTRRIGEQEVFADLLLAKTNVIGRIAPVSGAVNLAAGSALFNTYAAPYGVVGDTLAFYRLYDLGKRQEEDIDRFHDLAVGLRGTAAGIDYTATYTNSQSKSIQNVKGYAGALAIDRALGTGLIDPFVGPGQQSAAAVAELEKTRFSGYWDGGKSRLDTLGLKGSTELASLPAGPLMLGAGLSGQVERFQSDPSLFAQGKLADPVAGTLCDPTAAGGPTQCDQRFGDSAAFVPYGADRKAVGLFGELVIPAMRKLELTTSMRYDHYSDFGGATTAKGAFRWTPDENVLIRGSVGTGFHPPTVPQVSATRQSYGVTTKAYACSPELQAIATSLNARCQPNIKQYDVVSGGNAALRPERSLQGTLGIHFEPTRAVTLGADLWHVRIKDAIGQLTDDETFGNPAKYRDAWTTRRDLTTGQTYIALLADNRNLGKEYYTGLDIDAVGRSKLDVGDLASQLTLTYMIREARQLVPGGAYYSSIGNNAELDVVTFRWQGRWTNTLKTGNWAHTLGLNFKSGYRDKETFVEVLDETGTAVDFDDRYRLEVKMYVTLDWQAQWAPRKNLALTFGILNVADTKPPLAISDGGLNRGQQYGYDARYYDIRGRTLYGNLSYKF